MKSLDIVNKRKKYFTVKNKTRKNTSLSYKKNYSLSINKKLVSFRSTEVESLEVCNLRKAFRYDEKLKYKLKKCYYYDDKIVIDYLLKRIKNNKSIHISQIIAPKQIDANCWFNVMFMMFFISDKGRIFFHYFRELMIKGKTLTTVIDDVNMKNALALLNFIIECCLSGNPLAHSLNTNVVIKKIHVLAKEKQINVPNEGAAGNPIYYYSSLVKYLGHNELKMEVWKHLDRSIIDPPHIIILETREHKPKHFTIDGYTYELDSASIIDNNGEHFCSTLTCNGEEFVFDGYSKSRLIPFHWKSRINENVDWWFKDYIYDFETKTKWNFSVGYTTLCYYRI